MWVGSSLPSVYRQQDGEEEKRTLRSGDENTKINKKKKEWQMCEIPTPS